MPFEYKTYLKEKNVIVIKLRIIKNKVIDKMSNKNISKVYSMHRNTVSNIVKLYKLKAPEKLKIRINNNEHISGKEIKNLCKFLLSKSRRPITHPKQATKKEETKILNAFKKLKVGTKRLFIVFKRRNNLGDLTLAKIKGVYKRNGLKGRKIRTCNGETRLLYNYETIGAFENGHIDTKVLADAHSLPLDIYQNLKHNKNLPLYEWNIMFAGCRARFTAYSRGKSSTFGLQFLVLVLSHLRYNGIYSKINIQTDGGSEFFSGSKRKQADWNDILKELNCYIECYNPNFDIRKNLIERSHRSDDEEFLIPFGDSFKKNTDFMKHAQNYNDYWNKNRGHSGKGMNGMTPKEKLISLGFY